MNYIYHLVPKEMSGEVLFPLNTLKETEPDLYEKESAKYVGREQIMQDKLPILNCLWNDVLHLSAVHPSLVKEALLEAGRTKSFHSEFYEIDPHLLDPENTIVYLYKNNKRGDKLKEDNFAKYNPDDIAQYSAMPTETKDYYKEMYMQGKNPLLFHKIPHILYRGSLDVSKVRKIKV
jgi:hypothetical protein